jgi:hypothetical protein
MLIATFYIYLSHWQRQASICHQCYRSESGGSVINLHPDPDPINAVAVINVYLFLYVYT